MNEDYNYQTPPPICDYMVGLIPTQAKTILEPTPGAGNLVKALNAFGRYEITAPEDYFKLDKNRRFDCIVMNPPFSEKYAYGVPAGTEEKGMKLGYKILRECMNMSDHVIALMPWFTISDSDVRLRELKAYGLKSITTLPRKTFNYIRIQTMILELEKGYTGETIFRIIQL